MPYASRYLILRAGAGPNNSGIPLEYHSNMGKASCLPIYIAGISVSKPLDLKILIAVSPFSTGVRPGSSFHGGVGSCKWERDARRRKSFCEYSYLGGDGHVCVRVCQSISACPHPRQNCTKASEAAGG